MADDDALQAALAQFNEGLKVQQAEEAAKRAVDKAERRKQQAAATLKNLQSDGKASAEDKAAAEDAYRTAVDDYNRVRSGHDQGDDDGGEGDDSGEGGDATTGSGGDEPADATAAHEAGSGDEGESGDEADPASTADDAPAEET